ncbi:hypothetical protein HHI36_005753, partial [Cryptolaemus montrouzieri]
RDSPGKNYNINFDDELANASCLETINFFSEINENLLDNIPIVFQLAHNNDDTNYLLQCDDGGEKNLPDSVVERVDIGNLELGTNLSENRENGMAFTENSTTIDIENCDKSENGNENVDNENHMSYVENIMIGTNEYSAANGIENCGDDEGGGERVENENRMSNAEDTEKNSRDDGEKNVDEIVKKLKNVKRNRKSNSNTWE